MQSHLISATDLRNDDFNAAMRARQRSLLDLVGKAMGKDAQIDTE